MATNGENSGRGRPPTHGRYSLMRGLSRASRRTMLDRRTTIGKALAAWRAELLTDLGGIDAVSTQELALVEEAVKTKLILAPSWAGPIGSRRVPLPAAPSRPPASPYFRITRYRSP